MKTGTHAKDYYTILGVSLTATTTEIKRAYRRLAKQYHPDVNHNPDAAERFREITEAYDTLTDPDRRRRYDRLYTPTGNTGSNDNGSGRTRTGNTSSRNGTRTGNGPDDGPSPAVSPILKILEDTWLEIRRRHPEIPPVVIIIASGTDGKQARWGHHDPGRWHVAGQRRTEIMISGEGLRRGAVHVLGTLLHEAAHALAAERGVQDTSRQGRYHNKHFKHLAEELGLRIEHDPKIGWSVTDVSPATTIIYARQLADLKAVLNLWRVGDHTETTTTTRRNSNLIAATCPCARIIRVAASTLAVAPITCQACDGKFEPRDS
jgi:curved DNA-binding protein CbpA